MTNRALDIALAEALGIKVWYPDPIDFTDEEAADKIIRYGKGGDPNYPHYTTSGKPWRTHGRMDGKPLPRFSTTGDGLLALIAAMEALGWDEVSITTAANLNGWYATFWQSKRNTTVDEQWGATMPAAVAAAAAAALGIDAAALTPPADTADRR